MRIVTWNINSPRLRMELVRRFVQQEQPDVLCLQEIKVDDPLFPMEDVKGLGFDHVIHHGMKGYNGVAILSKLPLTSREPESRGTRCTARFKQAEPLPSRYGQAETQAAPRADQAAVEARDQAPRAAARPQPPITHSGLDSKGCPRRR